MNVIYISCGSADGYGLDSLALLVSIACIFDLRLVAAIDCFSFSVWVDQMLIVEIFKI